MTRVRYTFNQEFQLYVSKPMLASTLGFVVASFSPTFTYVISKLNEDGSKGETFTQGTATSAAAAKLALKKNLKHLGVVFSDEIRTVQSTESAA